MSERSPMPRWFVWLWWFMTGGVVGVLVSHVVNAQAFGAAIFSPLAIAYAVCAIGVMAVYLDENRA